MPRNNSPQNETSTRSRSRAAATRSTSQDAATQSAAPYTPTYDEIAEAAYHRYLQRGGSDGGDFDDWLEAERELKQRHAS